MGGGFYPGTGTFIQEATEMKIEKQGRVVWEREGDSVWVRFYVDGDPRFPNGHNLLSGKITCRDSKGLVRAAMLWLHLEGREEVLRKLFPEDVAKEDAKKAKLPRLISRAVSQKVRRIRRVIQQG